MQPAGFTGLRNLSVALGARRRASGVGLRASVLPSLADPGVFGEFGNCCKLRRKEWKNVYADPVNTHCVYMGVRMHVCMFIMF